MRVRLDQGGSGSVLDALLPITGRVLHPESNRTEWAITALDQPVSVRGLATELLCLRPATRGAIGGSVPIPVHVAPVTSVRELEGQPVYKLGELAGQVMCVTE